MTTPWAVAAAALGLAAGPSIRAAVFRRSAGHGRRRRDCPRCGRPILPVRRWTALPASGRCPLCRAAIGPPPLAVEAAAALALTILAARADSAWELAALSWLAAFSVPLAFIDAAVHRLPDDLTAAAFAGALTLVAGASLASRHPAAFGHAALGGAALACFCLALFVVRPAAIGLGDAKLAASVGTTLGWISWQTVLVAAFAGFALAALYGLGLVALGRAHRGTLLPLGPFIVIGALAAVAL